MNARTLFFATIISLLTIACATGPWEHRDTYADAFRLSPESRPVLRYEGDSTYLIKDWYGVPGYDVRFRVTMIEDSTCFIVMDADSFANNFYWVKTGLEDLPIAAITPLVFVPNHTFCSGFWGDRNSGRVWSYVYLYGHDRKWKGGHYYNLYWGEAPEAPLWTVTGKSVTPGDPKGQWTTMDAFSGNRFRIHNWYGVDHYDLDFRIREDGGVEMLDGYAWEEDRVLVQARRSDLGDPQIRQGEKPNGALTLTCGEGGAAPVAGRLEFDMLITDLEDRIMEDVPGQYVFEWDDTEAKVTFETSMGDMTFLLYNETPRHKDNFLSHVSKGDFDGMTFNRVIKDFMIQGGISDTDYETLPQYTSVPREEYSVDPEFRFEQGIIHRKGVLGAGRADDDVNPGQSSYQMQIYVTWGKVFDDEGLDRTQERLDRQTGGRIKLTDEMREVYKTVGGTPHLDGQYTIFGEIVEGWDVFENIINTQTDSSDAPLVPVVIRKARKL
ncbi:MAG: peptidylprolyl isomerase [Bacteroidales bacterium]|nr:peptidylprolyl isomerase [Bacteroidales bacterium]